jgi:hypothetical protein
MQKWYDLHKERLEKWKEQAAKMDKWEDRLDTFFELFGVPAFFDADKGTLRAMITLCEVDFNEEPK